MSKGCRVFTGQVGLVRGKCMISEAILKNTDSSSFALVLPADKKWLCTNNASEAYRQEHD